jgi:hypothetical protein
VVGGVLTVDVQLSDGCGRGREHAADEILLEEVNEPFAFALRGRWGDPLVLEMGGDIGRGLVGGVVNTALVAVARGDHGGGSNRSRRYRREGGKEGKKQFE